jgi:hypothetical protein
MRVIKDELDKAVHFYKEFTPKKAANAASSASMISMIFRFFLQSGEYDFFIRRLKNVVANSDTAPSQNASSLSVSQYEN